MPYARLRAPEAETASGSHARSSHAAQTARSCSAHPSGEILAGMLCAHSNRFPASNDSHCAGTERSVTHCVHLESMPTAPVKTWPQRAQRITSWKPGMLGARPSSARRSAFSARVSMRSAGGFGACGAEGRVRVDARDEGIEVAAVLRPAQCVIAFSAIRHTIQAHPTVGLHEAFAPVFGSTAARLPI